LWPIGLARGWADVCGPAKLVPDCDIIREIDKWDNPAVFMSIYNLLSLDDNQCRKLREVDLFVYIQMHPSRLKDFQKHSLLLQSDINAVTDSYNRILLAQPKFFWNSAGTRSLHWTQEWINEGLKWEPLYFAADPYRYYPEPNRENFGHIKMAYVGGYWPEKALGFDQYLRPWEEILNLYGVDAWPYKHYQGRIDEVTERNIYSTAGLIPLVTSPAGWDMGELTERYFKTPACKAFCISDHNPSVREAFNKDELLMAESPEHFHELVREMLKGKIDTGHWREKTFNAVMAKHLYKHRALQILKALEKSDGFLINSAA